ncbi:DUF6082 family protein [Streptomyces longispororuber]|uniref:DUF6082 family protein n=1 Tax=Streptomyces longispororuber TaxID=68230 RepID=UPI00370160EA
MTTQNFGIRGAGPAVAAGLACAAGVLVLLAAQQRRYEELRVRLDHLEQARHRSAELAQQQKLQFYLLSKAIDDPELAAVLSTVDASPTTRRQYLYANAMYTNVLLAYRVGVVSWQEMHGHLRVICRSPIFREYWKATRHHRESLQDSSDESRVGRMTDGLIRDLEEAEAEEWWVVGEPPPEQGPLGE